MKSTCTLWQGSALWLATKGGSALWQTTSSSKRSFCSCRASWPRRCRSSAPAVLRAFREVTQGQRPPEHNGQVTVGILGKVLLTQGKLDEADPLLVEAVACGRGRHTAAAALYYNGALVEPAAGPGAGAAGRGGVEAEQDRSRWSWVGAGHAGGRRTLGRVGAAPGHPRGRGDRRAARRC